MTAHRTSPRLAIATMPKKKPAGPMLEPLGDGTTRQRTAGDLGPKQLAWLKSKSMIFADAKDRVEATLAHAAEVAERIKPS